MKTISKLPRLLFCMILGMQLTSCGLLDFDLEDAEGLNIPTEMFINYDTVVAMRGDTLRIMPVFKPDTVNIKDLYIRSTNENVVKVQGNHRIDAVGVGNAKLYIESVSARLKDSCMVYVIDKWNTPDDVYPFETVFYTTVKLNGKPLNLTKDMVLAAFVGNECRAIGQAVTYKNISLIQFRVGSKTLNDEGEDVEREEPDDPDDEVIDPFGVLEDENGDGNNQEDDDDEEGLYYRERVTFRCYDKLMRRLYLCPTVVDFNGETYGSLSKPFEIQLK